MTNTDTATLRATTKRVVMPRGNYCYRGVLKDGAGKTVWVCECVSEHSNRDNDGWIPAMASYGEYPERLSALGCAKRELRGRTS